MKQCALFLTNTVAEPVLAELRRLVDQGFPHDTYVALDTRELQPTPLLPADQLFSFNSSEFDQWGFAAFGPRMVPGHTHFPLLKFYQSHRNYDYYWLLEHDVRFNGRWDAFFAACADIPADCLTCHVRSYLDEPDWYWWDTLKHPQYSIDRESRLRSLNVIYRLSRAAIEALIDFHQDGWTGHYEVLVPTLLHQDGFRVVDLGGDGAFVPPGYRNRFYTSYSTAKGGLRYLGSIRFRPAMQTAGTRRGALYHPVKPAGTFKPIALGERLKGTVKEIYRHLVWRVKRLLRKPDQLPPIQLERQRRLKTFEHKDGRL